MSRCCDCGHSSARVRVQDRGGARGHARAHGVGARREDNRHTGPEHNSRRIRLSEEGQVLRQHVAGLEVGYDENLRATRYLGSDALNAGGLGIDRVVERERTIEDAACNLSAIGHFT